MREARLEAELEFPLVRLRAVQARQPRGAVRIGRREGHREDGLGERRDDHGLARRSRPARVAAEGLREVDAARRRRRERDEGRALLGLPFVELGEAAGSGEVREQELELLQAPRSPRVRDHLGGQQAERLLRVERGRIRQLEQEGVQLDVVEALGGELLVFLHDRMARVRTEPGLGGPVVGDVVAEERVGMPLRAGQELNHGEKLEAGIGADLQERSGRGRGGRGGPRRQEEQREERASPDHSESIRYSKIAPHFRGGRSDSISAEKKSAVFRGDGTFAPANGFGAGRPAAVSE